MEYRAVGDRARIHGPASFYLRLRLMGYGSLDEVTVFVIVH